MISSDTQEAASIMTSPPEGGAINDGTTQDSPLLRLPEQLLDHVVSRVSTDLPGSALSLALTCKGLRDSALQSMYQEAYMVDCQEGIARPPSNSRLETIAMYPAKYGHLVKTLVIVPRKIKQLVDKGGVAGCETIGMSADTLRQALDILPNLTTVIWASDRSPPEGWCNEIATSHPQLEGLLIRPIINTLSTTTRERWRADGLDKLSQLHALSMSHVAIEGVQALEVASVSMANLKQLTIDSHFIDDSALMRLGPCNVLEELTLKCSGTKITDKGLEVILERCHALRSFKLFEVQGRITKKFWANLSHLPEHLKEFGVYFSQKKTHHSWLADHLETALNALRLAPAKLKRFAATSFVDDPQYAELNISESLTNFGCEKLGEGVYLRRRFYNPSDPALEPHAITTEGLDSLLECGDELTWLEIDMYKIGSDDLRKLLSSCKKLQHLRIHIDAPLQKLLGMSSAFVSVPYLRDLVITMPEEHCPLPGLVLRPTNLIASPPDDALSGNGETLIVGGHRLEKSPSAPSRTSTLPSNKAKNRNAPMRDSPSPTNGKDPISTAPGRRHSEGLPNSTTMLSVYDSSIPPKRDVRKIAKRCPSLQVIRWAGRQGKGEWHLSHPKDSVLPVIDFVPMPLIDEDEGDRDYMGSGADVEAYIKRQRLSETMRPRAKPQATDAIDEVHNSSSDTALGGIDGLQHALRLESAWDTPSPTSVIREWQKQTACASSPSSTEPRNSYAAVAGGMLASDTGSPRTTTATSLVNDGEAQQKQSE